MVLKFLTKSDVKTDQEMIDIRETFTIWDILSSKYHILERLEIYDSFIHDKDLKVFISIYLKSLNENKNILENLLQEYKIQGPDQGRGSSHWSANSNVIRDEFIAIEVMTFIQGHIENMLRATRSCITNDKIRQIIINMLKETIKKSDILYKYLKTKGWIATPPPYPDLPTTTEIISCATASHLWDHLTIRYDNFRETKIYNALVQDGDFKLLLDRGINKLSQQISTLEQECKKFGIPLPKKPPKVIVATENTTLFHDDFMYRKILSGLQGLSIIHAEALKQCTFNDRVRSIFTKMLIDEIDFNNSFIKYGKSKGWLNPVPSYRG